MTFQHDVVDMVNLFFISLNITVMINILQEILKIQHEQTSKAITFYWFHTDASDKYISLNFHSNEPYINR